MPHGSLHTRKRGKNFAILAAIAIWFAVIFAVTIIRIKGP